jgi:hypothetical protein
MRNHQIPLSCLNPNETSSRYNIDSRFVTVGILTKPIMINKPEDFTRIFEPQRNQVNNVWIHNGGLPISESKQRYARRLHDSSFFREMFQESINHSRKLLVTYSGTFKPSNKRGAPIYRDCFEFIPTPSGLELEQFEVIGANFGEYKFSPDLPISALEKDRLIGFSQEYAERRR